MSKNFIAFSLVLLVDQLVKVLYVFVWKEGYVVNFGLGGFSFAFFGWSFAGLLIVFCFFVLFVTAFWGRRGGWPFWFVFWGSLSNLADRVVYKGVIDYISFFSLSYFNLADVFVLLGILGLVRLVFIEGGRWRLGNESENERHLR